MQLMYAAEAGMTEAVKFLIECRANVNCTDKAGVTPVRLVGVLPIFPIVTSEFLATVQLMVLKGALTPIQSVSKGEL